VRANDRIFALTSLPPAVESVPRQVACLSSWSAAGLEIRSFNPPAEAEAVARRYGVDVVPVPPADGPAADRRYVRVKAMLDWAAREDVAAIVLNADIQLRIAPWEMRRIRWLADGGLCYFVRYNHGGDLASAAPDRWCIDGCLLRGRDAGLFPESSLSMGRPFWDYWLPYTFAKAGRPVWSVEFPVTFHRSHPRQWSGVIYQRYSEEFDRMEGLLGADRSLAACLKMGSQVHRAFTERATAMPQRPSPIGQLLERAFGEVRDRTFVAVGRITPAELQALAAVPRATLHRFGTPSPGGLLPRVDVATRPAGPHDVVTLDGFLEANALDVVDLAWVADAPAAVAALVAGAAGAFARVRLLYVEHGPQQALGAADAVARLRALLPAHRVVELWERGVLFENEGPLTPTLSLPGGERVKGRSARPAPWVAPPLPAPVTGDDTVYVGTRWGLCNRLKAVVSGMRIREELARKNLVVHWPPDDDCGATFDHLFETPGDNPITLAPAIPRSDLPEAWRLWISAGEVPRGFASNYEGPDGRSIDLEYGRIPERLQRIYARHFAALSPVPAIRAQVDALAPELAGDVVGVHVRRGDFAGWDRSGHTDDKFFAKMDAILAERPAARFVLATDSEATERTYLERYPGRVVRHPKGSRARNGAQAIRDAVVDLLLLARCPELVGSYASTFSEVAWWLGGCRARVTIIR
jgi:hypothetical protein